MPIFRYFAVVGSALLCFLFIANAYLSDDSDSRFNGSLYDSATYTPRVAEAVAAPEVRFTRDASPADHVREVFDQFVANDRRARRKI